MSGASSHPAEGPVRRRRLRRQRLCLRRQRLCLRRRRLRPRFLLSLVRRRRLRRRRLRPRFLLSLQHSSPRPVLSPAMCWYSLPRQALSVPRQCGGSVLNSRFIVMGGGAGGSPAPPPYLGEGKRVGCEGTFRLGGVPHPQFSAAGTRPGVRILRSGKLSCQRTVATHNRKEQQPSTTPTNGEAGVPHREPRPRPSSAECGHLYRLNTTAFAAGNGATASACQARALLTAIAPAPRSARIPAVPPRIAASLPVFASPWEGAGLLGTGVTGAVGITPAGV